jgi:MFS family permease
MSLGDYVCNRYKVGRVTAISRLWIEAPRPRRIVGWAAAPWLAVGAVCFGAFMGQLDASIVTLAFPALSRQFHASLAAVEWVSLGYLLVLVALLAAAGRFADAVGRKQVYLYGFVLFTAASAACGLAPSLGALIAFRAVQAIGAAMLQANSVALISTTVSRPQLRLALGVQAAAQAIGLAVGPTVGGILVSNLSWRWIFGINVPVGVLAAVAGYFLLPRTRTKTTARPDGVGVLLLAAATTPTLVAISAVSGLSLPTAAVAVLAAVAIAAAVGFWHWERRTTSPLIDPAALAAPAVRHGLFGALGGYLVLFGPLVLVPVVLTGRGMSEAHAGLLLTALPAGFGIAATAGNAIALPNRVRCVAGVLISAGALAAATALPLTGVVLVPLLAIVGLGLGVFTPANNAMIMAAIPGAVAGVGGGLVNLARGLGTAIGVALPTLLLHQSGPRAAFAALAAAAVLTAVVSTKQTRP